MAKPTYKELERMIMKMAAQFEYSLNTCQAVQNWLTDARRMMRTPGCGWPDASDSLRIAEKAIEQFIKSAERMKNEPINK